MPETEKSGTTRSRLRRLSDKAWSVSAVTQKLFCKMELAAESETDSVEISDETLFSLFFTMKIKYDYTNKREKVIS